MANWYAYRIYQGYRWDWTNQTAHSGVDMPMPVGTPLTAPVGGIIAGVGYHAWGGQVDIRANLGAQTTIVSFLHLSLIPGDLTLNQRVEPGRIIGWSGGVNSGAHPTAPRYSTGPHLHFELSYGDTPPYTTYNPRASTPAHHPLDPTAYISALAANGITNQPQNLPLYTDSTGGGTTLSTTTDEANRNSTPGGSQAHRYLVEVPGFAGIVEAIDAAERVSDYDPGNWPWEQTIYPLKWVIQNFLTIVVRATIFLVGLLMLLALLVAVVAQNAWMREAAMCAALP
ncbi:MAG: M23 family metallopeptidase [Chloroflexi bacterium]|nr:M23 family metallopeptidase [Chloroflexota bacterium]